jgi:SAM-dependent methyltransferase
VGDSGWTDELTGFHEDTAGEHHYIDIASREHAIRSLLKWVTVAAPVILDIGCSSGFLLNLIKQRMPNAMILGADYVPGPLEQLANRFEGLPLIQFDLLKCPIPDGSLDAVTLLNVLEHIEQDDVAVQHVFRILKPGGIAVLEVPAGPELFDVYDKQLLHWRRYKLSEFAFLIRSTGFEIIERSHLGFFLYPAFWLVKKRNRRHLTDSDAVQRAMVAKNIRSHANSPLMNAVMRIEATLGSMVSYPFGIRCLVVGRKPLR